MQISIACGEHIQECEVSCRRCFSNSWCFAEIPCLGSEQHNGNYKFHRASGICERNIIFTISTSGDESSGSAKCSNLQLLTQLFDSTIVSFLEKFHERQKRRKLHNSLLFNYKMNLLLIKFLCFCSIYFCRFVVQIPMWMALVCCCL